MERKQEIIGELNELSAEYDDIGETFIECVIDMREDEGLPPFTEEELSFAQALCDENAEKANHIDNKMAELMTEYFIITGKYPVSYGFPLRYREPFSWE